MKTLKSISQDSERNYKVTTIIYKFTLNQSKFKKLYEWIIKQRAIHKQRRPPPPFAQIQNGTPIQYSTNELS